MHLKFPADTEEVRLLLRPLGRAVRSDQEKPRRVRTTCELRDQLYRRVVTPVQVLQHQHEWLDPSDRLERVGDFDSEMIPQLAIDRGRAISVRRGPRLQKAERRGCMPTQEV